MTGYGHSNHVGIVWVICELCRDRYGKETRLGVMCLMPDELEGMPEELGGRWGWSPIRSWKQAERILADGRRMHRRQITEVLQFRRIPEAPCHRCKKPRRFKIRTLADLAEIEFQRGGDRILV